ncbi:MAG: PrgI family protein [Lachnospiraceae bacterium]|nr:PrgI family protein [Lachnospiraceae bacterium]
MEVKINKEIRNYTESMFFGLSLRQFVFSLLAIGVAVGLYFILKPHVGTETVSWMCILGAAPFAALGFVSYHGMTAEQFLWAWLRSEVIEPKRLYCKPTNFYYEALKDSISVHEKELSIPAKRRKPKHLGRYTKKAVRRRRKEAKRHA